MTAPPRLKVLMIEDDPADAGIFRRLLEGREARCSVEHSDRLAAGLERLAQGGIDLVLLDYSLPDGFGLDAYRAIATAAPAVPVIVLTSLDDDEVAVAAVAEGAQDYLTKGRTDARLLARATRYAVERHRAERELRASEERFALAVQGANDGLWDWDVAARSIYVSPRGERVLGFEPGELGGSPDEWLARIDQPARSRLLAVVASGPDRGEQHFAREHRMRRRDGGLVWVLTRGVVVRDAAGRVHRIAGSLTDISARKRAEEQLLHDALHDGLTGLANRTLFLDRLKQATAELERDPDAGFALLFLDLDRFKTVNDSLGHSVGDALLVAIAGRLDTLMRPTDTVARLGGDEFALLARDVKDGADAAHIAERVQIRLAESFVIDGHEVFASASIGIALPGDREASADSLLRDADLAMYRAKAAGRGRYEVFDLELHHAAVQLLRLETELRRAVAARSFVMHYQPIVRLDTGRIVGFEALTRWQHPERGLVAPEHFIALAEETGLVVPLGWLVLEEACAQARDWQNRYPADPPYFMSVNVSGKLFAQEAAVEQLLEILERSGLPPESLRLEVTENVVLDHGETVMERLRQLRAFGVELSIDDFGTGYSSLSYLQRFRYDSLKIDRSFVGGMEADDSRAIVETILSLASHLGIGVVAEGVETAEQLARLRVLGCPLGQGFWFARPLDAIAAEQLLASDASW